MLIWKGFRGLMEVRDQVAEGLRIADFGLKDLFSDEPARLNYPIYNC